MNSAEAPRGRAFEWFVAWRYLRDPERRSYRGLIIGGSLILLAVVATVASRIVSGQLFGSGGFFRLRSSMIAETVQMVALAVGIVGSLILNFGILRALAFSVFTAI